MTTTTISIDQLPIRWHVYFGSCNEIEEEIVSILPSMRHEPKRRVICCHRAQGCDLRYLGTLDHDPATGEVLAVLSEVVGEEFLLPDTA